MIAVCYLNQRLILGKRAGRMSVTVEPFDGSIMTKGENLVYYIAFSFPSEFLGKYLGLYIAHCLPVRGPRLMKEGLDRRTRSRRRDRSDQED